MLSADAAGNAEAAPPGALLPAYNPQINLGGLPAEVETTPESIPQAPDSGQPAAHPLFLQAQLQIPAQQSAAHPSSFATVFEPFTAASFARSVPTSGADIGPLGFTAKSAAELNFIEPDETGTTFEENARIKALASASAANMPALSDDSGLVVDALGGDPGVYTANWAETADGTRDFAMAMEKVEKALEKAGAAKAEQRTARFVSVLCLAWPDGHTELFRGEASQPGVS